MKVWQVTRDYYDGDHDHGYYDYGLYETEEAARKTAEKVAEHLVTWFDELMKGTKWVSSKGSWKWCENDPHTIHCSMSGEHEYISVTEKEVLTESQEGVENIKPTITYT